MRAGLAIEEDGKEHNRNPKSWLSKFCFLMNSLCKCCSLSTDNQSEQWEWAAGAVAMNQSISYRDSCKYEQPSKVAIIYSIQLRQAKKVNCLFLLVGLIILAFYRKYQHRQCCDAIIWLTNFIIIFVIVDLFYWFWTNWNVIVSYT
jgi:hypothetical protein